MQYSPVDENGAGHCSYQKVPNGTAAGVPRYCSGRSGYPDSDEFSVRELPEHHCIYAISLQRI